MKNKLFSNFIDNILFCSYKKETKYIFKKNHSPLLPPGYQMVRPLLFSEYYKMKFIFLTYQIG